MREVDAALVEGVRRAGERLACRPGCTECCHVPFPITLLDARRLAFGLASLPARRLAAVEKRARAAVRAMRRRFPGDPDSGRLNEDEGAREAFFERHQARPCSALDPRTGRCELYEFRPLTCRAYGPPVRLDGENLPPCRLCFVGASPQTVSRYRVKIEIDREDRLLRRLFRAGLPAAAETLVAYALAPSAPER